jgi:superfamily II DNA or RNA helicase
MAPRILKLGQTVRVVLDGDDSTTGIIRKFYKTKKEADVEIIDQALMASAPLNGQPGQGRTLTLPFSKLFPLPARTAKVKINKKNTPNNTSNNEVMRVRPKTFSSLYLKQFGDWMESTFFPYRESVNRPSTSERKSLKYYQRLIRDYIASPDSPYRGVLIYHGLGAGKTCTAIAAAEAMKSNRNVVVILPASIRQNFVKELVTSCGDPAYARNIGLMKKSYTFVSYNAPNALEQLDAVGSLDHHTIIIDEVHNLIQMMISPQSTKGPGFYRRLYEAQDVKIIALSGTPAIQNAFEIAILANLLRGNLITAVFQIKGTTNGRRKVDDSWLNIFTDAFANDPHWVHFDWSSSQIDAVYGGSHPSSDNPEYLKSVEVLVEKAKEIGIALVYQGVKTMSGETASGRVMGTPLFPEDEETFQSFYLEQKTIPISSLDMPDVFQDAANAAKAKRKKVSAAQAKKLFTGDVEVLKMKQPENFMRRLQGLVSYYPGGDPKIYPAVRKREFVAVPMSDYQFNQYEVVRELERDHDQKIKARRGRAGIKGKKGSRAMEDEMGTSLFRTLSRQFSNFVFPMNIQRPLKAYWKDLIGKRLAPEEQRREEEEMMNNEEMGMNGEEMGMNGEKVMLSRRDIQTRYDEGIQAALKALMEDPTQPLLAQEDKLGKYSPKMMRMYENIEATPGINLIYSFYKTLEGVGIMAKVLEANGWKRFQLPRVAGLGATKDETGNRAKKIVAQFWESANKNIQETKPGHVFAMWSGDQSDEERKAIQMIFNDKRNRYGAYIRVLLITKAAAEGVDLRAIRAVHIMDPHWNETLMVQVIGRAVRLGSHLELPEKERTVDVYRYLATMTPAQREKDMDAMSTDEYLLQLAIVKHQTVREVKEALRRSAFDCRIFAPRLAKEGHEGEECFRPPPGSSGMFYLPDWRADMGYGKVVSQVKRTKEEWTIVVADGDKKVYRVLLKEKMVVPVLEKTTNKTKQSLTDLKKPIRKLIWQPDSMALATPPARSGGLPTPVGFLTEDGLWNPTVAL